MAKSRRVHDVLNRLAAAEEQFLHGTFLAPVPRGGQVHVRVAGVVCRLKVEPPDFEGWGIFRPTSPGTACLLGAANLAERQRYLELFPRLRVVLCRRHDCHWLAVPAHQADRRFRIQGLLPVQFVEDGQLFDVVETRFDGTQAWYERHDAGRDPGTAAYLRQALQEMTEPDQLRRRGLTPEERSAYVVQFAALLEARRDRTEERLRQALAHAGAELRDYLERDDCYRVEYEVGGERHVSAVSKDDLSVQVAGVCLSGEDHKFDLQSLVGVLRESGGHVVRVGEDNQGMDEEQYWQVHPPRP